MHLNPGCQILLLKHHCPTEFSSIPNLTHLK